MGEAQQEQDPLARAVEEALASGSVPAIYANGFINVVTQSDVTILLQRNGIPVTVLNLSYTTAKSLAEKLSKSIATLEQKTEHTIMTTDDITKAISSGQKD